MESSVGNNQLMTTLLQQNVTLMLLKKIYNDKENRPWHHGNFARHFCTNTLGPRSVDL